MYREDQFDSGLWEPNDLMHGVEDIIIILASMCVGTYRQGYLLLVYPARGVRAYL
jgi:hypothetical protein